jgi:excisionase family DNA binding protein
VKAKSRKHAEPDEVLTIDELAVYLKIPKSSLYKLVRAGKIPSQKIGRHWRFGKRAIEQWLQQTHSDRSDLVAAPYPPKKCEALHRASDRN